MDQRRAVPTAYRADVAQRHRFDGRPTNEHDWMTTEAVAEQFGITRRWVIRTASVERLPSTKVGRRRWLRRDHVTMYMVARAVERVEAELN